MEQSECSNSVPSREAGLRSGEAGRGSVTNWEGERGSVPRGEAGVCLDDLEEWEKAHILKVSVLSPNVIF